MFKLTFDTDNDDFRDAEGDLDHEAVTAQLLDIANSVALGCILGVVTDRNGNTVGKWSITK